MTSRERVFRQILGEAVDRPPLMGGWINGVGNLAALASLSVGEYLERPLENLIRANRALGVDCMISTPIVPDKADYVRAGHVLDANRTEFDPETLKQHAAAIPDTEDEIVASLNKENIKNQQRESLTRMMQVMGDIVVIPTCWDSVPNFAIYGQYGYEAYLMAIALYPESVAKLYWRSAIVARTRNMALAEIIRELDLPPVVFTGHDICNNPGPMCSIAFLREHYFPLERYALKPLLDSDIRVVRHCDGNVMPMLDECIEVGYSGFQGFQYECGIDPFDIAQRTNVTGKAMLFFAGLNVTHTLPHGTIDDVRDEIEYVIDFTGGGRGLFFFTSSSIMPEVPLENVTFAYSYAANREYHLKTKRAAFREWPWGARYQKPKPNNSRQATPNGPPDG